MAGMPWLIWQDLVSDHGFAGGYQTVKRFVRKLRGSELPEAVGIILTGGNVDLDRLPCVTTLLTHLVPDGQGCQGGSAEVARPQQISHWIQAEVVD